MDIHPSLTPTHDYLEGMFVSHEAINLCNAYSPIVFRAWYIHGSFSMELKCSESDEVGNL
jgi:hypothetical protein